MANEITVVGAVIIRDGLVLCAQRGPAGALPLRWEFPGGKLEAGETPRDALIREIAEELHCAVAVHDELATTTHTYEFGTVRLTTFGCTLTAGEPVPTEHAAVRWLAPAELDGLDWSPADLPTVALLANRDGR